MTSRSCYVIGPEVSQGCPETATHTPGSYLACCLNWVLNIRGCQDVYGRCFTELEKGDWIYVNHKKEGVGEAFFICEFE